MNTRAVAAAHPSLAVPRHQGGAAPAPFPDPFGAAPASFPSPLGAGSVPAGTAATTSLPAAGSRARHASSQVAAARSPAAWPEPHRDPVPDDSHADLREPPDLDDLADHLNRILCDEARRHGIDV